MFLVDEDGHVLLFHGCDPARPDAGWWWLTPGGGIEDGETMEECARREVLEETGFVLGRTRSAGFRTAHPFLVPGQRLRAT